MNRKVVTTVAPLFVIYLISMVQIVCAQNSPKVDIKVNRQYDQHGNIIRYDSTYVYIDTQTKITQDTFRMPSVLGFSLPENQQHTLNPDSLLTTMDEIFDDPFFTNSFQEMEQVMQQMEKRARQIDSLFQKKNKQIQQQRNNNSKINKTPSSTTPKKSIYKGKTTEI